MDNLKEIKKDDLRSYLEKGKQLFQKRQYSQAIEQYQQVLTVDSANKDALFELGKTYYVLKKFPQAIELLNRAEKISPENEYVFILSAKSYWSIGKFDLALKTLMKLKNFRHNNPNITSELTSIFDNEAFTKLIQNYNFAGKYNLTRELVPTALNCIPRDANFIRNKLLNELEIAERKTILSSKPRRLTVTLSNSCNLSCIMCLTKNVKWEIPRRTVEEIFSLFPYLEKVMWQGGEVFALDFFEEILSVGFQYPNLRHSIVTNGQLITEKIAEKLVKNNVELTISVDGVTKEVYEHIRRGANFQTLIKNLKIISEMKKKYKPNMILNLNVAVMKSNYHQLEDFIEFGKEYDFGFICLMPIHIHLRTAEDIFTNQDGKALTFITNVSPKIEEKTKQYGMRLENRLPRLSEGYVKNDNVSVDNFEEQRKKETRKLLCHIPWQQLLIDYDGTVRPDCLCRIERSAGSLSENLSLEDIWNNEVMIEYRKKIVDHDYINFCNVICSSGKIQESHLKIP